MTTRQATPKAKSAKKLTAREDKNYWLRIAIKDARAKKAADRKARKLAQE